VNKHWAPIKQISSHLGNMITKDMKVLELGPSIIPLNMQHITVAGILMKVTNFLIIKL